MVGSSSVGRLTMMVPLKVKSCKGVKVVVGSSVPGRCMVPVVAVAQRSVFKEERKIKSTYAYNIMVCRNLSSAFGAGNSTVGVRPAKCFW